MNMIIRKVGKKIIFEESTVNIDKEKINVTNVWNFKEIIFEEKKLKDSFIQEFLRGLFIKENINTIQIEKIKMIPLVFPIIVTIPSIQKINIKENTCISHLYLQHFSQLQYITHLECYQMDAFVFKKCIDLKINVDYRKKEFVKSNFMIINDLTTISKIFYKKKITFYDTYIYDDFKDFDYFLEHNSTLEIIEFYGTNVDVFKEMIKYILKKEKRAIHIIILQRKEEQKELEKIVSDIYKKYKKQLKAANIHLQIKYTKQYREKNILKQLNLNIFRLSVFILFFLTLSIYSISKYHIYQSEKEAKAIQKIKEEEKTVEKEEEKKQTPPNQSQQMEKDTEIKQEENKDDTPKKEIPKQTETYTKDFVNLKKINNELAGWLTVNRTSISYPVVKHSDNDYYLKHGFNKKYNINGWIFMDYRNHTETFDQNTIIYGHDSNYSIMFGDLKKVLQKSWYTNKENQIITYETAEKKYEAQIFSIYVIDNTTDYLQVVFSDKDFESFIKKIIDRSIYDFNTTVSVIDKIITLSTCYKDSSKRLVVHAKIK